MNQTAANLTIVLALGYKNEQAMKYFCFLIALMGSLSMYAQYPLEKVKVGKAIKILVPENFILMSKAERIDKYVSTKEPLVMYTSEDRLVDFGINLTNIGWAQGDLELLKNFYTANIKNLYTEVDFIQQDIKEINGRNYVVFEFTSSVKDEENVFGGSSSTDKYTYIQYTLYNNQVMLFNFSSPKRLKGKWESAVKEMMNSAEIDE